jgi:RNA polymerase sigma factor (sigma-70 family)
MDQSELRAQLELHHAAAYRWALSCCSREPDAAADTLQAVYLKILQGRARYQARAAFKTWLFAVIRLTAADQRRREWLRRFRLLSYQKHNQPSTESPVGGERLDKSARLDEFVRTLARLPKRQRQIIHLVGCEGMTLQEASEVVGISLGSARRHYHRGKVNLREWLTNSEHFDEYKRSRQDSQPALI